MNSVVSFIKRITRPLYMLLRFGIFSPPFLSSQIELKIVPGVPFRIHYSFGRHGYDTFGDRHNAGFVRLMAACRGKKIIFDVGAHIGLCAIPAAKIAGDKALVVAFEPSAANGTFLKKHLAYNGLRHVRVESCLVGDQDLPAVRFYEHAEPDPMNGAVLLKGARGYREVVRAQITLDTFCQRENIWPDVVKIDVEGAEMRVLAGAKRLMVRKPLIVLSVHPKQMRAMGDDPDELLKFISSQGYSVSDPQGQPVTVFDFGEYILESKK